MRLLDVIYYQTTVYTPEDNSTPSVLTAEFTKTPDAGNFTPVLNSAAPLITAVLFKNIEMD